MANTVPFSMTQDAEDFLRSRLNEMPPGTEPVFMMTTSQSDGLKSPRWSYEGESFVVGYFQLNDKPKLQCTEFELFGRRVSVTSEALKELSGQTLKLLRVDARYGLMKNTRYVLVADSAPESPTCALAEDDVSEKMRRSFSIGALTVLGGFCGMGAVWIIYGVAAAILRIPEDRFFQPKLIYPKFAIGWILGAFASFFFFRAVYKMDRRTKFAQEQRQRRYLGRGGLEAELNKWIFLGIPASLMAVFIVALLPFAHTDTQKGYGAVVLLMVVLGGSMYFCDRMPRKLVFRLGILGWVFTFIFGYFFFKFHGP